MFHSDKAIQEARDRRQEHEQAVKKHQTDHELGDKSVGAHRLLQGLSKFAALLMRIAANALANIGKTIVSLFHRRSLNHAR